MPQEGNSSSESPNPSRSCILVDDDPLVRMYWEHAAQEASVDLRIFSRSADFLKALPSLDASFTLYLDYEIGEGPTGLDLAQAAHQHGFRQIYLVTGHPREQLRIPAIILGLLSKDAPF